MWLYYAILNGISFFSHIPELYLRFAENVLRIVYAVWVNMKTDIFPSFTFDRGWTVAVVPPSLVYTCAKSVNYTYYYNMCSYSHHCRVYSLLFVGVDLYAR